MKYWRLQKIFWREAIKLGLTKKKYPHIPVVVVSSNTHPEFLEEGLAGCMCLVEIEGKECHAIGIAVGSNCSKGLRGTIRHELGHLKAELDGKIISLLDPKDRSPQEGVEVEFLADLSSGMWNYGAYVLGIAWLWDKYKLEPGKASTIMDPIYLKAFPGTSTRKLTMLLGRAEVSIERNLVNYKRRRTPKAIPT